MVTNALGLMGGQLRLAGIELVTELADEGTQHSATEKPPNHEALAAQIPATVQHGGVLAPPAPVSPGWAASGPDYGSALDSLDRRVAALKTGR